MRFGRPRNVRDYIGNWWVRIGLVFVVLGWAPLFGIIALAALHLWPDPDPNPMGPGLLFFVTFWPAVVCLGVGTVQVARRRKRTSSLRSNEAVSSPLATQTHNAAWISNPVVRALVGIVGFILVINGIAGLRHGDGRGAAAALVLGVAALYWTALGRLPAWFRR